MSFLEQRGFQVLERNYRHGRGEIDIIALKEHLLIFVEVKTRSRTPVGAISQKVRWKQQHKIRMTAGRYMKNYWWYGQVRYDLIVVLLDEGGLINHYQGYFGQS